MRENLNVFNTNSTSVTIMKFTGFQASFSINDTLDLEKFGLGAILDVETTGKSPILDEIIQISIRLFQFERTNLKNIKPGESFSFFNQPKKTISEKITKLTGITNSDVKGKKIPWDNILSILKKVEVVVAHNAAFDRAFIDKEINNQISINWACSCYQIDWFSKGFTSAKLEMLCVFSGFFGNFHSADGDVDLLLNLLCQSNGKKSSLFGDLLTESQKLIVRSEIVDFPYDDRDQIKNLGYKWDPIEKMWYQVFYKDDYSSHKTLLEELFKKYKFNYTAVKIPNERKFASLKESIYGF